MATPTLEILSAYVKLHHFPMQLQFFFLSFLICFLFGLFQEKVLTAAECFAYLKAQGIIQNPDHL